MRFLSVIFGTLLLTVMPGSAALAQSFDVNEQFVAEFEIDAVDVDAETFKASLSGEAGPYGRVYLSYDFTNKQKLDTMGEFTGFAWTLNTSQQPHKNNDVWVFRDNGYEPQFPGRYSTLF